MKRFALVFCVFFSLPFVSAQSEPQFREVLTQLEQALAGLEVSDELRGQVQTLREDVRAQLAALQDEQEGGNTTPSEGTQAAQTQAALQEENRALTERLSNFQEAFIAAQVDLQALGEEVSTLQAERDELQADLGAQTQRSDALRSERDALTQQLGSVQNENEQLSGALEAAQTQNQELSSTLGEAQSQVSSLQEQLATLTQENQTSQAEREALQSQLESVQAEQADLSAQLSEANTSSEQLSERLTQAQNERDQLLSRLNQTLNQEQTLEESLTPRQDQLEQARTQASEAAETYVALRQQTPNLSAVSEARRGEVEAAQRALLEAQRTVARLSGAQAAYTVRGGDSLSEIAVLFYRSGSRWTDIVDANGYVLDDPDALIPGMVLVIPAG